ncbi:MAG: hypothetical protein CL833_02530 [Crocinitomicaceae bacterium]|nr:hypothetical protein [Crocinitomicaceae bacterium]
MTDCSGVLVKYGSYEFVPAPNVSISREVIRDGTNRRITAGFWRVTLDGTFVPTGTGENGFPSGAVNTIGYPGNKFYEQMNADYRVFQLSGCGANLIGRPLVENLSVQSDNFYTTTSNYNLEFVFAGSMISGLDTYLGSGLNLESASTSYNYSMLEKPWRFANEGHDGVMQIDRSISAKGISVGSGVGTGNPMDIFDDDDFYITTGNSPFSTGGFEFAVKYITGIIGTGGVGFSGNYIALPSLTSYIMQVPSDADMFLTDRSVDANPEENTLTVNDTFLAFPQDQTYGRPTGYAATDSFDISSDFSIEEGNGTITLNGTVQGYPSYEISFDGTFYPQAGKTSFENASGYFTAALGSTFPTRAAAIYSGNLADNIQGKASAPLNTGDPLSVSYSYNIKEGTVGYAVTYNNRPANCLDGVLSENISATKNVGVPVIASHTVLGRAAGPILQDIGTKTANTFDLSIEAVVLPPTGCVAASAFDYSPDYDAVVGNVETTTLSGTTYFRTADNETFDPKIGRYSRSVSWIYTECP